MELKISLGTNIGEYTAIKTNELKFKEVLVKVYFVKWLNNIQKRL